MNTATSLSELVAAATTHTGSWDDTEQALDIKLVLWATYDSNDDLIYPTIRHWDLLLLEAMADDSYDKLNKGEVLSVLFGLIHRTRIVEGLWESFLSRGVTQKLLERLLELENTD